MSNYVLLSLTSVMVVLCLLSKYLKFEKIPRLGGHINLVLSIGAVLCQICSLIACDYSKVYANGIILDQTFLCVQILLGALNITLLLTTLFSKSDKKTKNLVLTIISLVALFIFLPRNFVYDGTLNIKGGADNAMLFMRWFYWTVFLIFPMIALFKNKYLKTIALLYGIPVIIITIFNFTRNVSYFLDYEEALSSGGYYNYNSIMTAIKLGKPIRVIQFAVELTAILVVPLYLIFSEGYCPEFIKNFIAWIKGKTTKKNTSFNKKSAMREIKNTSIALVGLFLLMIPYNIFEGLFTLNEKITNNLSLSVLFIQFLVVVSIVVFHVILKRYNEKTRYMVLVIMAFALLLQFTAHYRSQMTLRNIPLQLCHVGTYLVFIALVTKWRPIIYFILLVNVTGAFIGLIAPEAGHALFSADQMTFTYEHAFVMLIPCVALSLGVIKMPDKKDLKYATIAYTCYFAFSLLLGVWLRNYDNSVNYFYLFNDVVGRVFPFARLLMVQKVTIPVFGLEFTFMPYYQIGIYFGYYLFIRIFYWLFRFLEKFFDETKKALKYRKERLLIKGNAEAIKRERTLDICVVCFFGFIVMGYVAYTVIELVRIAHML